MSLSRPLKNIRCRLAYRGTHYFGWQQTTQGPSIEETLSKGLTTILRHPITLQAASRTDRGVHARGQICNFFTPLSLDLSHLLYKLNRLLPKDISILDLEEVPPSFHPTLDCVSKTYRYYLCNLSFQLPFHRDFSWHVHRSLDLRQMRKGALLLEGTHNFSSFTNHSTENASKDRTRTITSILFHPLPQNRLCIEVTGHSFLYKMVRTLVGSLVYIGMGKTTALEMEHILLKQDRKAAGVTAPAHGLCLEKIVYS